MFSPHPPFVILIHVSLQQVLSILLQVSSVGVIPLLLKIKKRQ